MKFFYFLIIILWGGGLTIVYHQGHKSVEKQLISSLKDNEREMGQMLDVAIAYNESIKEQLILNFDLNIGSTPHPLISSFKNFPAINTYGLQGDETFAGKPLKANLTGAGSLADVDAEKWSEINAVLSLNLSAPLAAKSQQFLWSYYTSQNGFILLSPSVPVEQFHFAEYIYSKPFWKIATPEQNPNQETVVSDLYDDAAGAGLMISISTPVNYHDTFKGAVSLDIGLAYLNNVLHADLPMLENNISLLSDKGKVIANKAIKDLDDVDLQLDEQLIHYKLMPFSGGYYILSSLIKGKFYVAYQLSERQLQSIVVENIYGRLLIVSMFVIILWLLVKLFDMLCNTKKLAAMDGLSKLYNRMSLERLSNEAIDIAMRNDQPISVIMIDIDFFKQLNDEHGHYAGDQGIINVASVIKRNVRKVDIVGRYGGEEFVITVPDTHLETASILAERIRTEIEQSKFYGDAKVTVSIGVAESQAFALYSFQDLCKKADLALYQAKENGRNKCVVYTYDMETYNQRVS
ncbi:sensor domain-containing diguanylate cyclase [Shewanella subflava]|uniref:diguanylate cyclase n=1 Tax=Shewanella subflava TaxID=2986476 RepID=A0ABT3I657_9GAMM|nr:sensor domain-containing diguanylate cyclase [Shewanella subflava]MCW3171551.1 diguanylate cyclase [Shewanella subflava]